MPQVTFDKTSNVTGRLAVAITKDELNERINAELKKQKNKVNMKGFRKGKVPLSTLRKMMGNQVMGQELDNMIRESLFGYIEDNKINLIFSPQPVDDDLPTLSIGNLQDITFNYDLALEPEFELQLPEETFTKYVLAMDEAAIDEQVERIRKSGGENETIEEGEVQADDMVNVTISETGPVEDKISNDTKLYIDSLSDEGKALLIGKAIGATVAIDDLAKLERESTDTYVKKYLLDLEDADTDISGKQFELTINSVGRITPAELDEELFTKFDASGAITSEAELRQRIADDNAEGFNAQGEAMMNFAVQKALVEQNDIELPTEIMRRLHNEDEGGSGGYENFERGVKWMLIRNKYAAAHDIKLDYEDIRQEAEGSLLRMLGGRRPDFLTDDFLDNYVKNMLQDEKQRDELSANAIEKKILAHMRGQVNTEEEGISVEEFNKKIDAFNQENAPLEEE